MTGLKTLKDLPDAEETYYSSAVNRNKLKANAIKRAKKFKEKRDSFPNFNPRNIYYEGRYDEVMEANDLTEEDLEEKKK